MREWTSTYRYTAVSGWKEKPIGIDTRAVRGKGVRGQWLKGETTLTNDEFCEMLQLVQLIWQLGEALVR